MICRLLALLLLLPSLAAADYASTIQGDCAIHYYRMDAASGTTETDQGASCGGLGTNNGTYNGTFSLNQTGIAGAGTDKAASFVTNGYLQVNASTEFMPNTSAGVGWTIEFWFMPVDATSFAILYATTDATAASQVLWIAKTAAGAIRWHMHQSNCTSQMADATAGTYTAGVWNHVVLVTVGAGSGTFTSFRLYVNASLVSTVTSFSGTACGGGGTVMRLAQNAGNFYAGALDEVAFYGPNVALTQTQVTNHYTLGTNAPSTTIRRRIFQSKAWKWDGPLYLPVAFGLREMKPLTLDVPTFIVESMNKRAIRSPGMYEH